jgi:hypothetical protein
MLRHRSFWLAFVVLLFGAGSSRGFDDKAQTPVEVHEWSVWVANPAQTTWNSPRVYRNAMPTSVGTSRPKFEGKELDAKFPVASLSLAQFFGDPAKDVDVEVKIKQGALLAHWPPSGSSRTLSPPRRPTSLRPIFLSRTGSRSSETRRPPFISSMTPFTSVSSPTTPS